MPSLWQSDLGFGAPVFASRLPPYHPVSLLVSLLGIESPGWITAIAIVLAALGAISMFWSAQRFARTPTRARWLEFTLISSLAFLGMSIVVIAVVLVALLITRRSTRIVAALATALLLTSWWWLPAAAVWQWQRGPALPVPQVRTVVSKDGLWRSVEGAPPPERLFNSRFLKAVQPLAMRDHDWAYDSPFFDFLNIRFVGPNHDLNREALPRWFLVRSFLIEAHVTKGEHLRRITDFRDLATVNHMPQKMARLSNSALVAKPPRTVVELAGGRVEFVPNPARKPIYQVTSNGWNLMVSSVPWWEGWRVHWNGERLPPVLVNGAFLGAFVPPGVGRFEVRYHPNEWDAGLRVAAFGLLLLLGGAFWPWYERLEKTTLWIGDRSRAYADALAVRWNDRTRTTWAPQYQKLRSTPGRVAAFVAVRREVWIRRSLISAVLIYAAAVLTLSSHYAGGADSSGYANYARLWRTRKPLVVPLNTPRELGLPAELEWTFVPLGFTWVGRPHTMVPMYPPGLPLQMAALGLIGGERAGFLVAPLSAVVALAVMYLFGRALGFSVARSLAACAILASCATFALFALQPMSDVVAAAWTLIVLFLALRGSKSTAFAAAAGSALGIAVLVRPTEILLLPAALLMIGFRWRSLIAFGLGGLPLAVVYGVIAKELYGNPFVTSYGNMSDAFTLDNFPVRFRYYSYWLLVLLTPAVFPLGLAGALPKWTRARIRAALVVCFAAFFLFYCFYQPYEVWWFTRFILPGVPALILLALGGARAIWESRQWSRLGAAALLLAVLTMQNLVIRHFDVWRSGPAEKIYSVAIDEASRRMPSDALLVAMQGSGAYYYYTRRLSLRWDLIDSNDFKRYIEPMPREIYALIWDFETSGFMERTGASWVAVKRYPVGVTLYRLARSQVVHRDIRERPHTE